MMPIARIVKDYEESGALNGLVNLWGSWTTRSS